MGSGWRRTDGYPMVIAHGDESGNGLYPGNTLLYLQEMVALGVDALEMDLNLTADGHLILIHDPTVDRTTEGQGLVIDKSLEELQKLNAAYHWSRDGETFPYREKPLRFVTIDEVFSAIPNTPMIIELKNRELHAAEALSSAIDRAGCGERVIVSSFHHKVIQAFRRLQPLVRTGSTMREALTFFIAQGIGVAHRLKPAYRAMQLPSRYLGLNVYSPRFIRAARRCGLHIAVWTVDEIETMHRYIALGLDGIVTNRPDRLLALIREQ
ncbi:glycerophosphodiester phosphodiesterase [Microbulbifer aggregans]|uniref:glycerophosphodiester phosphodiesterase n=1 Tax=Microbulbifer aggregans TaxID=1769779 RepID=UPI001CFEEF1D|nr:glycerophosphodiester phosphodiesterase [Microbulbifer aggregans]